MKKAVIAVWIGSVILTCGLTFADLTNEHTQKADALKAIGMFSGSSKGYELNRAPNRVEAAVMLVRLLGKETEVKASVYTHPFTDVPAWATNYVGYMYTNQLSKGISETEFGANKLVDAKSYATFVLRALGYNDKQGEFEWATALDFAAEEGILSQGEKKSMSSQAFLRDEMMLMSYGALKASLKGKSKNLIDQLIEGKVVDPLVAVDQGIACEEKYKGDLSEAVYLYGTFTDVDYINEPALNRGTPGTPNLVTLMINKTANSRMMRVHLSANNDALQQKDVFAKMSFYNKGNKVFTVYTLPWFSISYAVFSADIIVEQFDEVRYVIYEPSIQSAKTLFEGVPYIKVSKDQYNMAISMMQKATYVFSEYVYARCDLTTDATHFLRALTMDGIFYENKSPFYFIGSEMTKEVTLINKTHTFAPLVGNPPKINLVLDAPTTIGTGFNTNYDDDFKKTGEYDLVINKERLAYFTLYDDQHKPTAILFFTE